MPCAGNHNDPYIRWVLHSAYSCEVSRSIRTPATQKGSNFGLKCIVSTHGILTFGLFLYIKSFDPYLLFNTQGHDFGHNSFLSETSKIWSA